MRRALLLAVIVVTVGCGEPKTATEEVQAPATVAAQPQKQPLTPPDFVPSELGLRKTADLAVKVGMTLDDGFGVFGQPKGSYEKSDLPPSVGEPFEARGWQAKDEGFGMILYKGKIGAAVYQLDHTSEDRLSEAVALQTTKFGRAREMPGKLVRYWFWPSTEPGSNQLLMICATQVSAGSLNVTEAIGAANLMDALGMTPEAASRDQVKAEKLIHNRIVEKGNPANSANQTGSE